MRTWMRSRFLRDDSSDRPDIVLKRRKWRRGTSPRALDLLLEIEEGIKKKKPLPVGRPDREHRVEVEARAMLKDRIRECPVYDCFTTVALSCHREIVSEVILYYYDVYCNNKYYISTFYKKSYASFIAKDKSCYLYRLTFMFVTAILLILLILRVNLTNVIINLKYFRHTRESRVYKNI